MSKHVMVDLETFGTKHDAVIVALGAIKFDPSDEFDIPNKFYCTIDPSSCEAYGLSLEANTVMWWMDSARDVPRKALLGGDKLDLASALEGFSMWFGAESLPVWGNGATFDNVILRSAYNAVGIPCPWKFWHDRCFRTFKNLAPAILPKAEAAHNALDDAVAQTEQLLEVAKHLGITL